MLLSLSCALGLFLVRFMKISVEANTDGSEALSVLLPEVGDSSAFMSDPDVPLILPEALKVGRVIGKGATGVVRTGIWHSL